MIAELDLMKTLLPEFPSTWHLPLEPNATTDDKIASVAQMMAFLKHELVIEEKVDGANARLMLHEGYPVIGNRNHILDKSYHTGSAPTNAKKDFGAMWSWCYEGNIERLVELEKLLGFKPSVYGEWVYARRGCPYELVPDWFVPYDAERQLFIAPELARGALTEAGFSVVPLVAKGKFTPKELSVLRDGPSAYGGTDREGIYLKATDGVTLLARFKMVSGWWKSIHNWQKIALTVNKRAKRK
jgi:hypothetical protein